MKLRIFHLNPLRLSMLIALALTALYIFGPRFYAAVGMTDPLEILEQKALDLKFIIRQQLNPAKRGDEVVIAAIDEKSVDEIGRWPWPRTVIGRLIRELSDQGAGVIAFDVGFFEPDANTSLSLLDRLEGEIKEAGLENRSLHDLLEKERLKADHDLFLAESIKLSDSPVALGYFFHMGGEAAALLHLSPEEVEEKIDGVQNGRYPTTASNCPEAFIPEANISLLAEASEGSGYFNMIPDGDGTVRRVPMTIACRGSNYIPLSLMALKLFLGPEKGLPILYTDPDGIEQVALGPYHLPTDEGLQLYVNYRGPGKTFPHIPITDIIHQRSHVSLRDKIVLIGATAVGIYDLRVTPLDSAFPGIEVHANIIDNILQEDFLRRPGWAALYDIPSMFVIALILGFALPRLSAYTAPLLGLGILTVWTGANYYLFQAEGIWVNFVYPLNALIFTYVGITIYKYMTEEREKKKIKGAFSSYVNPSVVHEMLKNPDMLKLGGDKRIATVLFSDIRGFTTISERLDPESLVHLLNQYLTVMTDIVFKYDGLLDKYIGDAIMAVWGAPLSQPQHALLACRSSLEMMTALEKLRNQWSEQDSSIPFIDIGVGLNSGPMVVGNMGSQSRMDYTAMGDSVNLGSRLEGANKQYGTNIIIGEMTFEQVKDELFCRELDSVAVKGKHEPVRIFELLGEPGAVPEEKLKMVRTFTRALAAYKSQNWREAERLFSAIQVYFPDDKPTELYLERIAELKYSPPPEDWDGVYRMKTK